VFPTYS